MPKRSLVDGRALTLAGRSVLCAALAPLAWAGCEGDSSAPKTPADASAMSETAMADSADAGSLVADSSLQEAVDSAATDDANDAPTADCGVMATLFSLAATAHSSGYSGTSAAYNDLFGVACQVPADCVSSCVAAGGTNASCAAGSDCVAGQGLGLDGGMACLPPAYWLDPQMAVSELGTIDFAAHVVLLPGSSQDTLIVSSFGLNVPDGARIDGIEFDVRRASGLSGEATDGTVRVLRAGSPVGADRADPASWPITLTGARYGGVSDTWAAAWTPADVREPGFGIALQPRYSLNNGSDPVYIDSVRAVVYYSASCP